MSIDLSAPLERLALAPTPHRPDWRAGLRAMQALLDEPDSTQHAFDVAFALDGDVASRRLAAILQYPEGRQLYDERPCLMDVLSDRDALAKMPADSFGHRYLEYMEANRLDALALAELRRKTDRISTRDTGSEWFAERTILTHDLWHVLTGYGTDNAGEASLLPFSLAQYGGRSNLLLSVGAGIEILRRCKRISWVGYVFRAWLRGRRAAPLDLLRYEELLPLRLADVRRAVGIDPPEVAHPGGIIAME